MKKGLLLLLIFPQILCSQVDRFKFSIDLSFGYTKHYFDEIVNETVYNTNYTYSPIHTNDFKHKTTTIYGVNSLVNFGLHIPFYKTKTLGFGIAPKVGAGFYYQIKPKKEDNLNDHRPVVNANCFNSELALYVFYDLSENYDFKGGLMVSGGVRYYTLKEKFLNPILSFDCYIHDWTFGYYIMFNRFYSYRSFSDGARELASSYTEYGGVKIQYLIKTKKKKKAAKQVITTP